AAHFVPTVYGPADGSGVAGHDHLIGIASTGGDLNVNWVPVAVLFKTATAAQQHLTTEAQVLKAVPVDHPPIMFPIPPATFHGEVVSAAVYEHGTPVA